MPERLRRLLTSRRRQALPLEGAPAAAVLVPIVELDGGPGLLFTLRTERVQTHKGQVAFPGGLCEERDADAVATALRETREEIGLRDSAIDVLGLLDDTFTVRNGFRVTPVVGHLPRPWKVLSGQIEQNAEEVAEVFVVPIAVLRATPPRIERYEEEGRTLQVPYYDVDRRIIWGATGRMVQHFLACADEAGWP